MWERFCEYIALFLMYFFSSFCLLLLSYDLSKVAVEIHLPHVDEIQFSSVAQSCPALRPHGLQHTRLSYPSPTSGAYSNSCPSSWWCHPTISSSVILFSPAFNLSQSPFHWVSSSYQVAKVLEFQLQHQSFQRIFRTDFLLDGLVGSPCSPRDSHESSPTPQFKSINSSALSSFYSPTLTLLHDYWKNHSFD